MQVGVAPEAICFGGKYANLLGALDLNMQMSWLSSSESSVMKRIEELQISEGASVEMWLKSTILPSLKEPAHSRLEVPGKLAAR